MLFNSLDFMLFFPIIVILYYIIPHKYRHIWLLVTSYYFYMGWNAKYALLIGTSTLITWVCGVLIEKYNRFKKYFLISCLGINLGILFIFKYWNFVFESLGKLADFFHVYFKVPNVNLLLPVGISFYTFQALSYTIDVYMGKIEAEKNIFKYALFVSFFPQLVAGPIERSDNLLKQVKEVPLKRRINFDDVRKGLMLMVWGLFIKMVIADRVSVFVDTVFNSYYNYGTIELFLAACAFALQIYCDFNGYSIVAIGAAQVMGFTLMENFSTPYFARSIKEFWQRWHISLSSWLRDYIYIPLGGNRCSEKRKFYNIMVTFLISGIWHGANWTYIVWGGIHGALQIIETLVAKPIQYINQKLNINEQCFSYKLGQVLITDFLVVLAWIFFRASNVTDAFNYIFRMFTCYNPWVIFDGSLYMLGLNYTEMHILWLSVVVLLLVSLLKYYRKIDLTVWLVNQNIIFRWGVLYFFIFMILIYGMYGVNFDSAQFIYFQF